MVNLTNVTKFGERKIWSQQYMRYVLLNCLVRLTEPGVSHVSLAFCTGTVAQNLKLTWEIPTHVAQNSNITWEISGSELVKVMDVCPMAAPASDAASFIRPPIANPDIF